MYRTAGTVCAGGLLRCCTLSVSLSRQYYSVSSIDLTNMLAGLQCPSIWCITALSRVLGMAHQRVGNVTSWLLQRCLPAAARPWPFWQLWRSTHRHLCQHALSNCPSQDAGCLEHWVSDIGSSRGSSSFGKICSCGRGLCSWPHCHC